MQMDGKDSFMGRLLGNAEKFSAEQVAQTIQLLIEHGVRWQASDIHVEPHEAFMQVRYRIDGELKGAHKIPAKAHQAVMRQLKTLAHLDLLNEQTPQQGHFTATIKDESYDITISIMPVYGGEKAVLHLAAKVRVPHKLESLGFWGASLDVVQTALTRSHGMIVIASPKHHGRSTTEASMLAELHNPALNIATVEEAIVYRIPHASQTVVNPRNGLTTLSGLQAVLHQDPNVILVDSVTNKPTAELCVQTALSGHLVLAGMHGDSAISSLLHLRSMNIPPYLLASTIHAAIGQRLIRKLCENCRERQELTAEQHEQLQRIFGVSSASAFRRVHELEKEAIAEGLGNDPRPSSSATKVTHLWRARREGCEACNHTGYDSRVAITEALAVNEKIQQALLSEETTASSLHALALKQGYVPLALDGLVKSLRGLVSINDVLHVVDRSLRQTV